MTIKGKLQKNTASYSCYGQEFGFTAGPIFVKETLLTHPVEHFCVTLFMSQPPNLWLESKNKKKTGKETRSFFSGSRLMCLKAKQPVWSRQLNLSAPMSLLNQMMRVSGAFYVTVYVFSCITDTLQHLCLHLLHKIKLVFSFSSSCLSDLNVTPPERSGMSIRFTNII